MFTAVNGCSEPEWSQPDASYELYKRSKLACSAVALAAFYATYYVVAAALSAALGTRFTGIEPFEHEAFTPAAGGGELRPLTVWLAMVLTFALFGPWVVYSAHQAFFSARDADAAVDVATVLQGVHVFATATLTQVFPVNWVWWATLLTCMLAQSQGSRFLLRKSRGSRFCSGRWRRTTVR
eukprot:CAMPEP_0119069468 /NCGR_PEP_ID=MMETSP1178-20130426/19581_1 /TAXON_ID=33656 /ORGANISM="unid sp, Strain CCMP2000" /LENGTH=180 /DNA_ID=CAMNT_0007051235 /DNA_START=30 /DNA_END=572 /DNA_ORIENTATION=-